jgi:hypothetical protein
VQIKSPEDNHPKEVNSVPSEDEEEEAVSEPEWEEHYRKVLALL